MTSEPKTFTSNSNQIIVRLTKERDELKAENKKLNERNLYLMRRCNDIWKELTEEKAKNK